MIEIIIRANLSSLFKLFMFNLSKYLFNNARKPKGLVGMCFLEFANRYGHKDLAEWALPFMDIKNGDSILDIGCGGGGNISRILKKFSNSLVKGIDYSQTSVVLSKMHNFKEIRKGRCQILKGDVKCLPYDADSFSIVTAFETVYYWSEIEKSFKEVLRVLKHDGRLIIVNGADAEGGWVWDNYIEKMHTYTALELEMQLLASGFKNVSIIRKKVNHFLCVIAYKS